MRGVGWESGSGGRVGTEGGVNVLFLNVQTVLFREKNSLRDNTDIRI